VAGAAGGDGMRSWLWLASVGLSSGWQKLFNYAFDVLQMPPANSAQVPCIAKLQVELIMLSAAVPCCRFNPIRSVALRSQPHRLIMCSTWRMSNMRRHWPQRQHLPAHTSTVKLISSCQSQDELCTKRNAY